LTFYNAKVINYIKKKHSRRNFLRRYPGRYTPLISIGGRSMEISHYAAETVGAPPATLKEQILGK
jgi:hypothetical protein